MDLSKNHKILRYPLILLLAFSPFVFSGQINGNEKEANGIMADSATLKTAKRELLWSDESWTKAKQGIHYTGEEAEEKEELTMAEKNARESFSNRLFAFFTSPMARILAIIMVTVTLVYLIVRLALYRIPNRKLSGNQIDVSHLENHYEIPPESDLEELIHKAIATNNFNLAIRLLYISIIFQLNTNAWIHWKKDKTNHDYLLEMRHRTAYSGFQHLTMVYETIWYGDNSISIEEFQTLQISFMQFRSSINQESESK